MRDYSKVGPQSQFWIDHHGTIWKAPTIKGRLKMRIPCHKALRDFVLHRDNYLCVQCGESQIENLVADHIVSRRNGGAHHPANMQCLCRSCNARKSALIDSKVKCNA